MRASRLVVAAALALVLGAGAARGGMEEGRAYYLQGSYMHAFSEFRPLAEAGNAEAAAYLGEYYLYGLAGPRNYAKALQWYQFSATHGNADGQLGLGIMYAKGQGVPRDYVQAYMWLSLCAAQFPPGGDRDKVVATRDDIGKRMSPEALADAQRRAAAFKPEGP